MCNVLIGIWHAHRDIISERNDRRLMAQLGNRTYECRRVNRLLLQRIDRDISI